MENLTILSEVWNQVRRNPARTKLAVMLVDFIKAFGTVEHEYVWAAFRRLEVGEQFVVQDRDNVRLQRRPLLPPAPHAEARMSQPEQRRRRPEEAGGRRKKAREEEKMTPLVLGEYPDLPELSRDGAAPVMEIVHLVAQDRSRVIRRDLEDLGVAGASCRGRRWP